jgi:hypothetical protein
MSALWNWFRRQEKRTPRNHNPHPPTMTDEQAENTLLGLSALNPDKKITLIKLQERT